MDTKAETYDRNDPIRNEALYTQVLRVATLMKAAELLAEHTPELQLASAPPIYNLITIALDDLEELAERVSP